MDFARGNKAIRDHMTNGKSLHLFEDHGGDLTYEGQLVYDGHDWQDDVPDGSGNPRRAIVFRLVPTDDGIHESSPPNPDAREEQSRWTVPLQQLAAVVESDTSAPVTQTMTLRRFTMCWSGLGLDSFCGQPSGGRGRPAHIDRRLMATDAFPKRIAPEEREARECQSPSFPSNRRRMWCDSCATGLTHHGFRRGSPYGIRRSHLGKGSGR